MTLLWLGLAWLGGVALAALGGSQYWVLALPTALGLAAGFALGGRPMMAALALAAGALAVGGTLRFDSAWPPKVPSWAVTFNDGTAVGFTGVVVSEPEDRGRTQRFDLEVASVEGDAALRGGKVQVTTTAFPRLRYGDRVTARGRLSTPPRFDSFDFREYLARKDVFALASFPVVERTSSGGGNALERALWDVRRSLASSLEEALPEPEASLAAGMLLGLRAAIPDDISEDFNRAGISHIVAISGYNVSVLAAIAMALLAWPLRRRPATIAAMVAIVGFVLLTGASAGVTRAGVMGIVMLGAQFFGRPGSGLTAIVVSAVAITALHPPAARDVSFQLSFAATTGIVLASEPLGSLLSGVFARKLPLVLAGPLASSLAVTSAATLAAAPILAATFGSLSLAAFPTNLIAVPLAPIILAGSAVTALVGVVWSGLGTAIGEVTFAPLWALIEVGRHGADIPGAALTVEGFGTEAAVVCSAALALIAVVAHERPPVEREQPPPLQLAWLYAAVVVSAVAIAGAFDMATGNSERLSVSVLDVGQGDAILIETPAGHRILVDGGPSGSVLENALRRAAGPRVKRIDLIVLTHGQDDHVTGLVEVLRSYEVGVALVSPRAGSSGAYREFEQRAGAIGIPVRIATPGEWLDLGGDSRIEVLGPLPELHDDTRDDVNDSSVVLRLVTGDVSFLLTGDLTSDGEAAMLASPGALRATVLKVGHHGSAGSTSTPFLAAVGPAAAAISAGADNPYGHPAPSTQLRLAGIPFFRTDLNGNIRFETDGRRLWAKPERGTFRLIGPEVADAP